MRIATQTPNSTSTTRNLTCLSMDTTDHTSKLHPPAFQIDNSQLPSHSGSHTGGWPTHRRTNSLETGWGCLCSEFWEPWTQAPSWAQKVANKWTVWAEWVEVPWALQTWVLCGDLHGLEQANLGASDTQGSPYPDLCSESLISAI